MIIAVVTIAIESQATETGERCGMFPDRSWVGRRRAAIEDPFERHERFRRCRAGSLVDGERRSVIRLCANPHPIAAPRACEVGQRRDNGPTDPTVAMAFRNRQLVQEHLRALVRVGRLHAADEANGTVIAILDGYQQVMAVTRLKRLGPFLGWRSVEEFRAREQERFVTRTQTQGSSSTKC